MLKNENENYCGVVVRVTNLIKLDKLDNLKGFPCFGEMAIVDNSTNVGDLGVFFTCGTKLSEKYCYENNLNVDSSKNKDQQKKGYVSGQKVRKLKLKGNLSTCLYLPLESLSSFCDIEKLKEGDSFTHVNGHEICSKYIVKQQNQGQKSEPKPKKERVLIKMFPEHIDTSHFLKNLKDYNENDFVVVTEKIHSVSARFGNIKFKRNLSFFEKILKRFNFKIEEFEYRKIAGSRRVIKYLNQEESGYYKKDIWNEVLLKIQHLIPKNVLIFCEIVGWDKDKKLQKNYSYNVPKGEVDFYVYRMSFVNEDGFLVDFSWEQIKTFCIQNNIKHVPEIYKGYLKYFNYSYFENKKFNEELGLKQCLLLDKESPCSEGLIIRKDIGFVPHLTKYKSPLFLAHESDQLDEEVIDLESLES